MLIAVLALAARRERLVSVPVVLALFAIVLVQALLGMLTVTWQLKPLIVTAHLLFGLTTLALLVVADAVAAAQLLGQHRAAQRRPRHQRRRRLAAGARPPPGAARTWRAAAADRARRLDQQQLRRHRLPGLSHLPGQLVAARRLPPGFVLWHGLNIDYEGGVLDNPARVAIHLTHRLGALLAAVVLGLAALYVLLRRRGFAGARRWAWALLAALALQLAIGVSMVLRGFPLWLATLHTAGAALLLLATLALLRSPELPR